MLRKFLNYYHIQGTLSIVVEHVRLLGRYVAKLEPIKSTVNQASFWGFSAKRSISVSMPLPMSEFRIIIEKLNFLKHLFTRLLESPEAACPMYIYYAVVACLRP